MSNPALIAPLIGQAVDELLRQGKRPLLIAPTTNTASPQFGERRVAAPLGENRAAVPLPSQSPNGPMIAPVRPAPAQPTLPPGNMMMPTGARPGVDDAMMRTGEQPHGEPLIAPAAPAGGTPAIQPAQPGALIAPGTVNSDDPAANTASSLRMIADRVAKGEGTYGGPMIAPVTPSGATQPGQPDYLKRYQDWESARPTLDPNAGKPSLLRRIFAALAGGAVGYSNPREGEEMAEWIAGAPRRRVESDFERREKQWEDQGKLITGEMNVAEKQRELISPKTTWRPIEGTNLEMNEGTGESREISGMIAPAPKGQNVWKPIGDTNLELNESTGETRQIPGMTAAPAKRFTNPFEAFTYGGADERKAAQEFISFEKRQGQRYEKPGEIEQRYTLYKRDPEAYKAMFGDRGAAQDSRDQAQATRMLQYFDKQRKAIQNDFTLDDEDKRNQLSQIDELERPYLDIAQPGGSNQRPASTRNAAPGPRPGEVEVISPGGVRGYIPKGNLAKALKSGYTQPSAQGAQ